MSEWCFRLILLHNIHIFLALNILNICTFTCASVEKYNKIRAMTQHMKNIKTEIFKTLWIRYIRIHNRDADRCWWRISHATKILKDQHSPPASSSIIQHVEESLCSSWLESRFSLVISETSNNTPLLSSEAVAWRLGGQRGRASSVLGWTPVKSLWLQGMGCAPRGWQSFTVTLCMSEFTSKGDAGPATSFHWHFQRLLHHAAKWAI